MSAARGRGGGSYLRHNWCSSKSAPLPRAHPHTHTSFRYTQPDDPPHALLTRSSSPLFLLPGSPTPHPIDTSSVGARTAACTAETGATGTKTTASKETRRAQISPVPTCPLAMPGRSPCRTPSSMCALPSATLATRRHRVRVSVVVSGYRLVVSGYVSPVSDGAGAEREQSGS